MMYSPPRHTFSVNLTSSKLPVCMAAGRRRVGNETLIRRWRRRSAPLREGFLGIMTSLFLSVWLIGVPATVWPMSPLQAMGVWFQIVSTKVGVLWYCTLPGGGWLGREDSNLHRLH